MKNKNSGTDRQKADLSVLWLTAAVLLIACISTVSVIKLRSDLYNERAYNSEHIMSQIAANIRTVLKARVDHADFDAKLISDCDFKDEVSAAAYLKDLEDMGATEEGKEILLLIDDSGNCLASDGTAFKWGESGILHTRQQHILVSSINPMGLSDEHMLFLTSLPKDVKTGDRTYTHICLVMDQNVMAKHLSQTGYADKSALFIIQSNGTYIYKQAEGSAFSDVFNLISKLEKWDYLYNTSAKETVKNILEQKSGCSIISVNGENYYAVYESLGINDWTAVYIMPENDASGNSSRFMNSIIRTVLVLAFFVMISVTALLADRHFRMMKQQERINEQLRRAMEAERSANDAKTRFLSAMSHDIRTPMNAIVGMTAIAENHINDHSYVRDCLEKIHLASDHLLTLINDILDISKIESGKMMLTPNVFSLAESVNNMFNIVRPQAKAKGQTFEVNVSADSQGFLMADELRLNQIFINILTNAVKYTPENGKITASVISEQCEDDPDTVKLTYIVEDNGIGMTEEFMENMYGSFSRATDSRINKIQGTGLGLAICKQLADMMGGSIECESAVGKGTKFTVSLRLPAAEDPDGDYTLDGMRILLVDDDEIFLETSYEILHEMEAELDIAESGQEAISMIAQRHGQDNAYTVILMDWKMSGLDGIETLKRIHSDISADIPVILISAYDSTDIEQIALEAGAAGFIRKPFFKAILYRQLEKYMDISYEDDLSLKGMKVLVAEDNDLNWEIASELLGMAEVTTERAENGKICAERLEASCDGEFDAVLMDIQMPVMDGKEASRRIRKSDRDYLRKIPIIAVTADAFAEDINACLEAGMNGHIPKPIDFNRFFSELEKIRHSEKKKGGK